MVADLSRPNTLIWIAVLIFTSATANAQRSSALSADLPDSRTMALQNKVDRLFGAGNFERAFFLYRYDLAPLGDKYAQYMVGFLYLSGMGVEKDSTIASAWYRLAAERGTPEFVAVRDRLLRDLNDEQRRRSDDYYRELRLEYCDLAVLMSSIRRSIEEFDARTGSRVPGANSGPLTVIDVQRGTVVSGEEYYGMQRKRLELRVKLLQEAGDFHDMETDPDKINLRELERRVQERIAQLNQ